MRIRSVTSMIAPAALLLALAAGCRGKRATYDDIPIYPGAVQVDHGHSSTARELHTVYEGRQSRQPDLESQYRIYALPASANASEIKSFYEDKLIPAGWMWAEGLAKEANEGPFMANQMVWKRDGTLSLQGLDVTYFFDGRHNSSFMAVALVSKK